MFQPGLRTVPGMSSDALIESRPASPPAAPGPPSRPDRGLAVLAAATVVGSAGLAAGGTAGGIAAAYLAGSASWAGAPLGLLVAGSAAGAMVISRRSVARGRASAIALGYAVGAAGALGSVVAIAMGSLWLLLVTAVLLGWGNAAVFLTRYAAVELTDPARQGRALGIVLGATAVGAVLSPNLLGPGGSLAEGLGLPAVAGLYVLAAPCYLLAAVVHGRRRSSPVVHDASDAVSGAWRDAAARATFLSARTCTAIAILGASNLVMVGVMAIVPIWMDHHGHGLGVVGTAVSVHVLGMFGPAPLTGWLADRVGADRVALAGLGLLAAAGLGGTVLPPADGPVAIGFLLVLGLGWNAGVVGASAMLAAAVQADRRMQAEGVGEAAMGIVAGLGGPGAGVLAAHSGFAALCLVAGVAAAVAAVAALLSLRSANRTPART
jgi:MFS family permease